MVQHVRVVVRIRPGKNENSIQVHAPPPTTPRKKRQSLIPTGRSPLKSPGRVSSPLTSPTKTGSPVTELMISNRRFVCDAVLTDNVYQQAVGNAVRARLQKGQSTTLLCYGQTASGKTHTLQTALLPGVLQELKEHSVSFSCFQLAQGEWSDLLEPQPLVFRNGQVQATAVDLTSENSQAILERATENRLTFATAMNATSSRSHAFYQFRVNQCTVMLIDLAGSERLIKSKVEGKQQQTSIQINSDLFVLGKVLNALSDETRPYVPFRDSPLTLYLRDSFSSLILVACVSPDHVEETIQTLRYAERARNIVPAPTLRTPDPLSQLQAENERLKLKLQRLPQLERLHLKLQIAQSQAQRTRQSCLQSTTQYQAWRQNSLLDRSVSVVDSSINTSANDISVLTEPNHRLDEQTKGLTRVQAQLQQVSRELAAKQETLRNVSSQVAEKESKLQSMYSVDEELAQKTNQLQHLNEQLEMTTSQIVEKEDQLNELKAKPSTTSRFQSFIRNLGSRDEEDDEIPAAAVEMLRLDEAPPMSPESSISVPDLRIELDAQQQELEDKDNELTTLQETLQANAEELESLHTKCEAAESQLQEAQAEVESLRDQVKMQQDSNNSDQSRLDELEQEKKDLQAKLQESEAQLSTKGDQLQVHLAKMEVLRGELETSQSTIRTKDQEVESMKIALNKMRDELRTTQEEASSNQDVRAKTDALQEELRTQLVAHQETIQAQDQEINNLTTCLTEAQEKAKTNEEQLKAVKDQADATQQDLRDQLEACQETIQTKDVDLEYLKSSVSETQTCLEQAKMKSKSRQEQLEEMTAHNEALQEDLSRRDQEATSLREHVQAAADEIQSRDEKLALLEFNLVELRAQTVELEANIQQAQKEVDNKDAEFESQVKEFKLKLEGKEDQILALQRSKLSETEQLQRIVDTLTSIGKAKDEEIGSQEAQIESLEAKLEGTTKQLNAARASALVLKAHLNEKEAELERAQTETQSTFDEQQADLRSKQEADKQKLLQQLQESKDHLHAKEEELQAAQWKIQDLVEQAKDAQAEMEATQEKLVAAQARNQELEAKLLSAQLEMDAKQEELVTARAERQEVRSKLDLLDPEFKTVVKEMESSRSKIEALHEQCQAHQDIVHGLHIQLDFSQKEVTRLESELDAERKKLNEKVTRLEEQQKQIQAKQTEVDNLKVKLTDETDAWKQDWEKLQSALDANRILTQSSDKQTVELQSMVKHRDMLEAENDNLRKSFANLRCTMAAERELHQPAESVHIKVPFSTDEEGRPLPSPTSDVTADAASDGDKSEIVITNMEDMQEKPSCSCETFCKMKNHDFFLPQLNIHCTCGKEPDKVMPSQDPTALKSILRPWQVKFLATCDITESQQLVDQAGDRIRRGEIASRLIRWRKKHKMDAQKIEACRIAVYIWSRTCRAVLKAAHAQKSTNKPVRPDFLQVRIMDGSLPDIDVDSQTEI